MKCLMADEKGKAIIGEPNESAPLNKTSVRYFPFAVY